MVDGSQANKIRISKYWRLFEFLLAAIYTFAVVSLITTLHNPEWHSHLLRLFGRAWSSFVAQDVGSTSRGFLNATLETVLSIFAVAVMIRYLHGFQEFRKHITETGIIALFAIPPIAVLVYGTQLVWEVAKAGYADHTELISRVNHLHSFEEKESRFQHELSTAEAKSDQWRDAYTGISKGEVVPDRTLGQKNIDQLHDELKTYAKYSGNRIYSTARIAPAFYDDQESSELAEQLFDVFRHSEWSIKWEPTHWKALKERLYLSRPVGIVIYTDNADQGSWIVHILDDVGMAAHIASDTPEGFRGTLVCVGYKQNFRQIAP